MEDWRIDDRGIIRGGGDLGIFAQVKKQHNTRVTAAKNARKVKEKMRKAFDNFARNDVLSDEEVRNLMGIPPFFPELRTIREAPPFLIPPGARRAKSLEEDAIQAFSEYRGSPDEPLYMEPPKGSLVHANMVAIAERAGLKYETILDLMSSGYEFIKELYHPPVFRRNRL